jgi:zinc/manganese transport system permease protein
MIAAAAFTLNPLSDLQAMLAYDFMRSAFIAGGSVALASGLVGYFVVLRNQVFTTDALGHVAFTGGLGGLLAGVDLLVGVFGSCIAVALLIGALGGRSRGRDVVIGTVFAWVLGVGVLLLSLYTSAAGSNNSVVGISILFGSIFGLQPAQALVASVAGLVTAAALLIVARPLLFLSVDPDVAASRGVPVRIVTTVFLILVAVTVAEAVQAVGALLVFALMVTPAAIAQSVTTRPYLALALSAGVAGAAVWLGLTLAFWLPYPASFFITSLVFVTFVAVRVAGGLSSRRLRI